MAGPAYKPLAVNVQGSLPGVFDTAAVDFGDAQKAAEALQAQELANQINEINAQKAQQAFDAENQLRESLKQQFGTQEDGTTPTFDPNAALETAMRLAGQQGDLDTMLNVTKAQRTLSGDRELTDVEAAQLNVPLGTTLSVARAMQRSRDLQLETDKFKDPLRVQNRELDATLKEQRSTGTQIRAPTEAMVNKIGASDAFDTYIQNIEDTYMPYVSENRGERFLARAVNPNSAEARLNNELQLAAKQAALSMEPRVTDQDYQIIANIATPNDLDTNETIIDRMHRLRQFVKTRIESDLNAADAGGYNVEGLKNRATFANPGVDDPITAGANSANPAAIMIPKAGGSGPYVPPGSKMIGVDPGTGLAIIRR